MTALWILLGLLALAALALLAPVKLELFYDAEGFSTAAHLGPFRLPFPGGEAGAKPAKQRRTKPRRTKPAGAGSRRQTGASTGGSDWKRLLRAHWRQALEALGDLLRRPRLSRLELTVVAGGDDPPACALAYGRCWAAVGSALPLIRSVFQVGSEQVRITCNDQLKKTAVQGRAVFTLRVYELLQALLVLAKLVQRLRNSPQTTKKAVQQP